MNKTAAVSDAKTLTPALQQTRERIIEAAGECFRRLGDRKTSISDIARMANLSRATIYQHFTDKADIVEAVAASYSEAYYRELRSAMADAWSLEEHLGRAAVFVNEARKQVNLAQPWQSSDPMSVIFTTHADALLRKGVEFFTPYFAAAIDGGEVRRDVDPSVASEWFMRMLFSIFSIPTSVIDFDDPVALKRFVHDYFIRAIRPTG